MVLYTQLFIHMIHCPHFWVSPNPLTAAVLCVCMWSGGRTWVCKCTQMFPWSGPVRGMFSRHPLSFWIRGRLFTNSHNNKKKKQVGHWVDVCGCWLSQQIGRFHMGMWGYDDRSGISVEVESEGLWVLYLQCKRLRVIRGFPKGSKMAESCRNSPNLIPNILQPTSLFSSLFLSLSLCVTHFFFFRLSFSVSSLSCYKVLSRAGAVIPSIHWF